MKTLDLNAYGVEEMNANEMEKTEGGCLALLVIAAFVVVGLIMSSHKDEVEVTYSN